MRPVLTLVVLLACLGGTICAADARTFPYEAVVSTETFVRSGQGKKFYPTGKLKVGERVMVHRHDPGAWFMVAPPPGSFNWILAKYVNRNGNEGTVNTDGASARVGSSLGDDRTVEQLPLNSGDMVKILDEKTLLSGRRNAPESWLKIAPPRGQWRWVMGQHVVAASDYSPTSPPRPLAVDKRTPVPSEWKEIPAAEEDLGTEEAAPVRESFTQAPIETRPPAAELEHEPVAQAIPLQTLDAELRGILELPKDEWDFTALRSHYEQSRAANTFPSADRIFVQRLSTLDRLEKDAEVYREVIRITDETARRDEEILARMEAAHAQFTAGTPTPVATGPTGPTPTPIGPAPGPTDVPTPIAEATPVPTPVAGPVPTPTPVSGPIPQAVPRFDGAGIVQRAPGGTQPGHVLIAPDGRVLAFLVSSAGVNMDVFVGREAGVRGNRTHSPELKSDLINVSSLVPVRLAR